MELFELLKELEVSAKSSALLVSLFWDVISFVGWAVGAGAAVILGLFGWLWRRIETLNKESKADIKSDIGRLDSDIKRLEVDLRNNIRQIHGNLLKIAAGGRSPQGGESYAKDASPIVLTPKGKDLAEKIGAKALAEKYADKVELPENASRLEIHDACYRFAWMDLPSLLSQEEKHLIDDVIFEGEASVRDGVPVVLGVLLRDCLFEKRGIEVPVRKPEGEQTPPSPQQQTPQSHPHA